MFSFKSRRPTTGLPAPVSKGIQGLIETLGIGTRLSERRTLLLWDEVVGPEIAQATQPDRISRGCLHIKVKTATWRHALLFHREEIRHKLNGRLGEELVKQIVLK